MKEKIERNNVRVMYIKTHKMLADILTKPMSGEKFYKLVKALLNHLIPLLEPQGCVEQNYKTGGTKMAMSGENNTHINRSFTN